MLGQGFHKMRAKNELPWKGTPYDKSDLADDFEKISFGDHGFII